MVKNYYKPIHWWIEYRKGEPIPKELIVDGLWKYEYHETIYPWIDYRKGETMPDCLCDGVYINHKDE